MNDYCCIYQLPSGNYNVRPTWDKKTYNLGTYPTEKEARDILDDFRQNAHSMDHDEAEYLAKRARDDAASARAKRPKAASKRDRDRFLELQTQIDQLVMQVDILKNRVERMAP